jgi:hypothetical protein
MVEVGQPLVMPSLGRMTAPQERQWTWPEEKSIRA